MYSGSDLIGHTLPFVFLPQLFWSYSSFSEKWTRNMKVVFFNKNGFVVWGLLVFTAHICKNTVIHISENKAAAPEAREPCTSVTLGL